MYVRVVKRLLDILSSFLALVVLLPVFLVLALCIKIDSKGPVLFRQKRVGRNKKLFTVLKFRTMHADAPKDVPTHLLQNAETQITKMGHFLRKTSLDELPQVWNIFVGEMSVVGPRPALWNQDDLVAARDVGGANALRPGLTGYAQINGRDELPIAEKAALDNDYAAHIGFALDVKIFFATIARVFRGSGVVEGTKPPPPDK